MAAYRGTGFGCNWPQDAKETSVEVWFSTGLEGNKGTRFLVNSPVVNAFRGGAESGPE